jgi:hypothetical protein
MCGCGCELALVIAAEAAAATDRARSPERVPALSLPLEPATIGTLIARWLKRASGYTLTHDVSVRIGQ